MTFVLVRDFLLFLIVLLLVLITSNVARMSKVSRSYSQQSEKDRAETIRLLSVIADQQQGKIR